MISILCCKPTVCENYPSEVWHFLRDQYSQRWGKRKSCSSKISHFDIFMMLNQDIFCRMLFPLQMYTPVGILYPFLVIDPNRLNDNTNDFFNFLKGIELNFKNIEGEKPRLDVAVYDSFYQSKLSSTSFSR